MKSPFTESECIIQEAWKDGRCPIINGIIYGNGKIKPLNITYVHDEKVPKYNISYGGESADMWLADRGDVKWTYITQLFETHDEQSSMRISCGEGGMGADGYVALSKGEDDALVWVAFFDRSNPFTEVRVSGATVYAKTTLDNVWQFPIAEPQSATIE